MSHGEASESEAPRASGEPAAHERVYRQLAAMRLLLNPERDPDTHDVLLATAFEALTGGPKSLDEVISYSERVWPGAVILRDSLERALTAAAERGLVATTERLDTSPSWRLADRGELRIEETHQWVHEVMLRCEQQVASEFERGGYSALPEQTRLWTQLLYEAIDETIAKTFARSTNGTRVVDSKLFPPYDRDELIHAVTTRCDNDGVLPLITQLALASLDPQSTFGSELVHYVATGYVLYSFMAREDLRGAQDLVGSLAGEIFILDTPILVRTIASPSLRRSTLDVIGKARKAGIRLALLERTVVELNESLDRRRDEAMWLEREVRDGIPRERLSATISDEFLLSWLEAPWSPSWDQFRETATEIPTVLKAMGVEIGVGPTLEGFENVIERERLKQEIVEATARRGGRHRVPVDHDAGMMLYATQQRRQNPASDEKVWPGAMVVTPDKALNKAYCVANPDDSTPITVTFAQFASIVARGTEAAGSETLAQAISRETSYEARLARAIRLPPDQAIELARAITGSDADEIAVEAEALQLSFTEILDASADKDPDSAARSAIVRFEQRRSEAGRSQIQYARDGEARYRERVAAATARAEAVERERDRGQDTIRRLQMRQDSSDLTISRLRRGIVAGLLYATVLAGLLIAWLGFEAPALPLSATLLAAIATTKATVEWVIDTGRPWWHLLVGGVSWLAALALGLLAEVVFVA